MLETVICKKEKKGEVSKRQFGETSPFFFDAICDYGKMFGNTISQLLVANRIIDLDVYPHCVFEEDAYRTKFYKPINNFPDCDMIRLCHSKHGYCFRDNKWRDKYSISINKHCVFEGTEYWRIHNMLATCAVVIMNKKAALIWRDGIIHALGTYMPVDLGLSVFGFYKKNLVLSPHDPWFFQGPEGGNENTIHTNFSFSDENFTIDKEETKLL